MSVWCCGHALSIHAFVYPRIRPTQNFEALTGGAFRDVDWTNLLVAGGAVLGCMLPGFELGESGFGMSDVDIFIHGLWGA